MSTPDTPRTLGLLAIGNAVIGVDVAALQEVIPCPPRLHVLPAASPALRGAVHLRDLVIPVLDLRQMLQLPGEAPDSPVVVVIRHAQAVLGLLADAVRGTAKLAPGQLQPLQMEHGSEPAWISHVAEIAGEVVSVLDVPRLGSAPGVPWVRTQRSEAQQALASHLSELLLLFRCGPFHMAIAAAAVASTAPSSPVHDSALKRAPCLGTLRSQGVDVPLLDLPVLLGLAPARHPPPDEVQALLLKCDAQDPQAMVALTVDAVTDMARVQTRDVLAAPVVGLARPGLFRGVVDWRSDDGSQASYLLLDHAALAAEDLVHSLAQLSRTRTAGSRSQATAAGSSNGRARAVLTFNIGHDLAVPLVQVSEIIPMRAQVVPTGSSAGPIVGVITHRGLVTTLIDLAQALGHAAQATDEHSRVLLVREGPHQLGFIVQRLGTVDECQWQTPARTGEAQFDATEFRRRPPLVQVGAAASAQTLALLDLASLTRGMMLAA